LVVVFFLSSKARHIMTQVVKGVLYLHSHGIIHRDLTLGNILLTREMDAVSLNWVEWWSDILIMLSPIVQSVDNVIQWINPLTDYPAEVVRRTLLDCDLSRGKCCLAFSKAILCRQFIWDLQLQFKICCKLHVYSYVYIAWHQKLY